MTAKSNTVPFILSVAGQDIPLHAHTSTKGNECFALMRRANPGEERKMSAYGVKIPALAAALPTKAVLSSGDQKFRLSLNLTHGVTKPKDETKPGNPKVSFLGKVELPGVGARNVTVQFSLLPDGNWNAIVKAIPPAASREATTLDDLW